MNDISENRRNFLKKVLTVSVFSMAAPKILLGKIEPEIKKSSDNILGLYYVKISDYPVLKNDYGMIRIHVDGVKGFFPRIIIIKLPRDTYNDDYACLSEQCPHQGFPVKDFNLATYTFQCSGHGTLFDADGTYIMGPASKNLVRFALTFNGNNTIAIEIPALPDTSVDIVESSESMLFLSDCFPNPCSVQTSFRYGVESAGQTVVRIFDIQGRTINSFEQFLVDSDVRTLNLDVSGFENGVYFYELTTKYGKLVKKFVVNR